MTIHSILISFLLSSLVLIAAHARMVGPENSFREISAPSQMYNGIAGCEQFNYGMRLTDLKNVRKSRNIAALPMWENSQMGGVFGEGLVVDPLQFDQKWGHLGASSSRINADEAGVCLPCIQAQQGNPNSFLFADTYNGSGNFHYAVGRPLTEDEQGNSSFIPIQMINYLALDPEYQLAYSKNPRYSEGSGEVRLFIPFTRAGNGSVVPNTIKINNQEISLPSNIQNSLNYSWRQDLNPRLSGYQESAPGLCVVFFAVSSNSPHYTASGMDGGEMSSFRNNEVSESNSERTDGVQCPLPDWGYEGYYYSYKAKCLENFTPQLNEGCRCMRGYNELVCYNDNQVVVMDCAGGDNGTLPSGMKDGHEAFTCEGRTIKLNGVVQDCCQPGDNGYANRDIGYACSHAVRNPDFTRETITNTYTGKAFILTQEK